jgi:hypothetical protein
MVRDSSNSAFDLVEPLSRMSQVTMSAKFVLASSAVPASTPARFWWGSRAQAGWARAASLAAARMSAALAIPMVASTAPVAGWVTFTMLARACHWPMSPRPSQTRCRSAAVLSVSKAALLSAVIDYLFIDFGDRAAYIESRGSRSARVVALIDFLADVVLRRRESLAALSSDTAISTHPRYIRNVTAAWDRILLAVEGPSPSAERRTAF